MTNFELKTGKVAEKVEDVFVEKFLEEKENE